MNGISPTLSIQPTDFAIGSLGNLSISTPDLPTAAKVGADFLADAKEYLHGTGSEALQSRVTAISDASYDVGSIISLSVLAVSSAILAYEAKKLIDVVNQPEPKYHKHYSGYLVEIDKNGGPVFNEYFYNYNLVNEKGEVQKDKQGRTIHVEMQGDLTVISDQGNPMLVHSDGSRVKVGGHHVLVTLSENRILATEEGDPVKIQEGPYEGACILMMGENEFYLVDDRYRFMYGGDDQQRISVNPQNESIGKMKNIDAYEAETSQKYYEHKSGHLIQVDKNDHLVINGDFYNYNLVNKKGEVQKDKQGRTIHVETQGDLTVISDQGNCMLVHPDGSPVMVGGHHVLVTLSGDRILATEEGNPVKIQEGPYEGARIRMMGENEFYLVDHLHLFMYEGDDQQRIRVNPQNESIGNTQKA